MTMHLVHRQCTSARSSVMQIADVEWPAISTILSPLRGKQCIAAHTGILDCHWFASNHPNEANIKGRYSCPICRKLSEARTRLQKRGLGYLAIWKRGERSKIRYSTVDVFWESNRMSRWLVLKGRDVPPRSARSFDVIVDFTKLNHVLETDLVFQVNLLLKARDNLLVKTARSS